MRSSVESSNSSDDDDDDDEKEDSGVSVVSLISVRERNGKEEEV